MKTFPIMLDLRGRLAVVVGGGPVGTRKIRALLETGATVKLIAQEIDADISQLKSQGVTVIQKQYCAEYLDGALLVFACTDDRALNAQIARDAHWAGAIVNAADQPDDCEFFLPAVASDGEVVVAIGTGGSSPYLAGLIRNRLKAALPEKIGLFAAALAKVREELKEKVAGVDRRGEIMKQLAGEECYKDFLANGEQAIRERFEKLQKI